MWELEQGIKHLLKISHQIQEIEQELYGKKKTAYSYRELKEQWAMLKRLQRVSVIIQLVKEKKVEKLRFNGPDLGEGGPKKAREDIGAHD